MTYLVERVAELRRHLDHLRTLRFEPLERFTAIVHAIAAEEVG